jgi:hypothetical protein
VGSWVAQVIWPQAQVTFFVRPASERPWVNYQKNA